jgi:hypothetical protein
MRVEGGATALQNKHYFKIRSIAGGPHTVELSAAAFRRGIDAVVPGAGGVRRQIVAILVNDPPASNCPIHELAELTARPILFVLQSLKTWRGKARCGSASTLPLAVLKQRLAVEEDHLQVIV